jgi:hypothetical protein
VLADIGISFQQHNLPDNTHKSIAICCLDNAAGYTLKLAVYRRHPKQTRRVAEQQARNQNWRQRVLREAMRRRDEQPTACIIIATALQEQTSCGEHSFQ